MLWKLENGELIQIDLSHDDEGKRYVTVYGVQWEIPNKPKIIGEIIGILDTIILVNYHLKIILENGQVFKQDR